jgi:hypothetical protein
MNTLRELKQLYQMFRDKKPVAEIEARVAWLCEIAEAEEQARLSAINAQTRLILECLDAHGDFVAVDQIAREASIDRRQCVWLCERLVESKHIHWGNPDRYTIEQKGRDVLHDAP